MDGLDNRGRVVVFRATNRVDSIDGALRRPGGLTGSFSVPVTGLISASRDFENSYARLEKPSIDDVNQSFGTKNAWAIAVQI